MASFVNLISFSFQFLSSKLSKGIVETNAVPCQKLEMTVILRANQIRNKNPAFAY